MIIDVYQEDPSFCKIDQIPLQRSWMDETFDRHAYHCFPMSLANRLGWGISYPEDISFIWDGVSDSSPGHVTVLSGNQYVTTGRENATISFNTRIIFSPEKNISLLTMPVPNQFIRGTQCIATITSSTALVSDFPIAWKILEPNIEITIKAGTPICAIIPLSLSDINNSEINLINKRPDFMNTQEFKKRSLERGEESQRLNRRGIWTHFYRDAKDHNGDQWGSHEAKKIIMKVQNAKD